MEPDTMPPMPLAGDEPSAMTPAYELELLDLSEQAISDDDPSHDFGHALRVMKLVKHIAQIEGGDLHVLVPAALFHDCVMYPKDDPRAVNAATESAAAAGSVLQGLLWFPSEKVAAVQAAIVNCSFSKNIEKATLEEFILQDADLLESVGAISIARTFSSTGQMRRAFYHRGDPIAENRQLDPRNYALDLFGARLFKVTGRLHTKTARAMEARRERFLHEFVKQFLLDIDCEA